MQMEWGGDQGGEVEGKVSTVIDESAEKMLLFFVFFWFVFFYTLHDSYLSSGAANRQK